MYRTVKILALSALCAFASVSLAGNLSVTNDTACYVNVNSGTTSKGPAVTVVSYNMDANGNPTSVANTIPAGATGNAPLRSDIQGNTIVALGQQGSNMLTISHPSGHDILSITGIVGSCSVSSPCFAVAPSNLCGSTAAKLGAPLDTSNLKIVGKVK